MSYVYMYIPKEKFIEIKKYGIKLSKNINRTICFKNSSKSGIISYLSPKDTPDYDNKKLVCIKVFLEGINALVFDAEVESQINFENYICSFKDYILGTYINPYVLITSTILPENIFLYNRIVDTPLIIQNSKEFYYEKKLLNSLDNFNFEDILKK